jgi:protease-4
MSEQKTEARKRTSRRSRGVTALLVGVTVLVLVMFGTASLVAYLLLSNSQRLEVEDGSYLRLHLAGQITDAPAAGGFLDEPSAFPMTATEIASVLRHAANDERIIGLYLTLETPQLGWGLSREIRSALVAFRAADKPCVAYAQIYLTKDYYIASACDKVLMAPAGVAYVSGIEKTVMYYRDALESLGIEPQFVHVGDYKTAVEPFERSGPSEPAIEANEALLSSLYSQVVSEIAAGRGLDESDVRVAIDSLQMSPKGIVASGLVDGLAYPERVKERLGKLNEAGWIDTLLEVPSSAEKPPEVSFVQAKEYRNETNVWQTEADGVVAVVFAEGVIMSGRAEQGLFGTSGMLYDNSFRDWMKQTREDDEVKAVVVRVNSPGGSALASDFMWREVALTKASGKPVVVSMGDYAASGGYMMSCNADWIVAQPTTITGSIGVFGQFFSLEGLYGKIGLTEHTFKRGAHADLLSPMDRFSETEREILRVFVRDTYDTFVGQVAAGRARTVAQIEPVAQGRVWTGQQALVDTHALVDQLGGLHDAIEKAADLAGISQYNQLTLPEQKGFLEVLLEEMSDPQTAVSLTLPVEIRMAAPLIRELQVMQNIESSGRVGAYTPGWQ